MRVKKSKYSEFEVYCQNCKNTIIVEGPEDFKKELQDGEEMFSLTCPVCGREIWFDGIVGYTLELDFRKEVKFTTKNPINTNISQTSGKSSEILAKLITK